MKRIIALIVLCVAICPAHIHAQETTAAPSCELTGFLRAVDFESYTKKVYYDCTAEKESTQVQSILESRPDMTVITGDWRGPCGTSADCILRQMEKENKF